MGDMQPLEYKNIGSEEHLTFDSIRRLVLNQLSDSSDHNKGDEDSTDPKRLFLRNIAFDTSEEDIKGHFSRFGAIEECHIPVDDRNHGKGLFCKLLNFINYFHDASL